jgi:alpha-L-rhamnosidase
VTDLKPHFITVERPYKEGTVEVFEQEISARGVKKAELAITALGVYEAEIDGSKVGDIFLAPGYTYYPKDLHVQVYDVTNMLSERSVLRVYLGQGWYCGRFTCDNKTQIYGEKPAVSWVLTVETEDGEAYYRSDDSTVKAVLGPYESAGEYDGEIYFAEGAPRETADEVIQPVKYEGALPEVLETSDIYVKVQELMPIKSVTEREDVTIIDFGQNFAGIIEIDPEKMDGGMLKLRHGEILSADGGLYTNNLRTAKAEIIYHKGVETKKYRPRFTYMGFRYVELSGVKYRDGLLSAYALHSEMERTGWFECENKAAQRLFMNQLWGQRSNYVEVPTDCPQRDERQGYTGDGHVFAQTGAYNYDTEKFWLKFLKDIRYSQADNSEGYVAPTIPAQGKAGIGFMTMLGWGNCVTIVPEMLYRQYGSDRALKAQYESMKTFTECEIRHMVDKNLWLGVSLGDWLAPGKDIAYMAMHNNPVSNAFILNDLRIMAWAADYLGKPDDAARYSEQLEKSRAAYLAAFVTPDGSMTDDYQGAYVMALRFAIPKGGLWNSAFKKLVEKIISEGMQTGFFATQHLLPLLADNGEVKLAYDLLLQNGCPGWMYQIERGATTTWERWDAIRPDGTVNEEDQNGSNMVSFNHYSFGSVGEFYYRYILGIQPLAPGFEKISIRPFVDERLGGVSGRYLSRKGEIKVAWRMSGETVKIEVSTPADSEIILPDGSIRNVQKGEYRFESIYRVD